MSDYGDYEPEDAWHPDDEIEVQMVNIRARFELLGLRLARIQSVAPEPDELIAELDSMADAIRQHGSQRVRLQSADNNRTLMLIEDIEFVRERLR